MGGAVVILPCYWEMVLRQWLGVEGLRHWLMAGCLEGLIN